MEANAGLPVPEFDALLETHGRALFAYLWRLLGSPAEAEDCYQETWLRAFRAYPRLRRQGHPNPAGWLYRIATNTARTSQRRLARARARTLPLDDDRLIAREPGPADLADQAETLRRVARAVEALPHQQRAALILRKYQALSYAEVGAALGCSAGAARASVYQALLKLRAALAPEPEPAPG
jgi:RNA polymerase sigma-70 factor (ECF subfamily)